MNAKLRLVINEKLPISEEPGAILYKANESANHISSNEKQAVSILYLKNSLVRMASTFS